MGEGTERVLRLMRGEERGAVAALSRAGLWALSRLYALGIGGYWLAYRVGLLKRVRLRPVVFSVGNITVGGTGKTTTIQYLARALCDAGLKPAVLSYGYRAASPEAIGVVSDGERVLMDAASAGDEAVLLARSLTGVPVLIGRRRVLSGAEAELRFRPDVLLCDDAFQYWRLHRDIDLLLVDAVEPWGHGYVLPRGLLREPKRQARRADAALITHADLVLPGKLESLRSELSEMGLSVWTARHAPRSLRTLMGEDAGLPETLRGMRVMAVSSLGDPASFEETLRREGSDVLPRRFPDHHRYTAEDVQRVEADAAREGRRPVTTAKDAVKIQELARQDSWRVLEIALAVDNEASFRSWVLQAVEKWTGKA